jgi:hypothetical protein
VIENKRKKESDVDFFMKIKRKEKEACNIAIKKSQNFTKDSQKRNVF